jgi:hypothetical protein
LSERLERGAADELSFESRRAVTEAERGPPSIMESSPTTEPGPSIEYREDTLAASWGTDAGFEQALLNPVASSPSSPATNANARDHSPEVAP